MKSWGDLESDVQRLPLDSNTADRLLAGDIAPKDAPPGYAEVAAVVRAALSDPEADELDDEAKMVAVLTLSLRQSSSGLAPKRSSMSFSVTPSRISAALVATLIACTVGLASAGTLPGEAQEIASDMLAKVGISVSDPNENAGTNPGVRGPSEVTPSAGEKGNAISQLATGDELSGLDKGVAISTVASEGKSQAGMHRSPAGAAGGQPALVARPNEGGTGTADTASGGASDAGTPTADSVSDGHSGDGSKNSDGGQAIANDTSGGKSTVGQSHKS
jgi:hypothetical protein